MQATPSGRLTIRQCFIALPVLIAILMGIIMVVVDAAGRHAQVMGRRAYAEIGLALAVFVAMLFVIYQANGRRLGDAVRFTSDSARQCRPCAPGQPAGHHGVRRGATRRRAASSTSSASSTASHSRPISWR